MQQEARDWYDTPLYYDIIYDADTRKEADLLEHVFAMFATAGKTRRVLEPACGSGRLVMEMARRGWSVSGFDGSAKMLDFARERLSKAGRTRPRKAAESPRDWSRTSATRRLRDTEDTSNGVTGLLSKTSSALKARLWEDWMQSFEVPGGARFDLAHCLINTFRYLLTEKDAASFFQRVTRALRPGGVFVLGLHLTDYARTSCEHERWVMDRKGVHVVCNTRTWPADRRARIEKLRTRLEITHKGRTCRQETLWDYRTYDAAQLRRLIKTAAPELEIVACHDFTCNPASARALDDEYADIVVVLRKKR